jgi:hypothetical protein
MWTFPDDYPKRVGDAVYEELPAIHREAIHREAIHREAIHREAH